MKKYSFPKKYEEYKNADLITKILDSAAQYNSTWADAYVEARDAITSVGKYRDSIKLLQQFKRKDDFEFDEIKSSVSSYIINYRAPASAKYSIMSLLINEGTEKYFEYDSKQLISMIKGGNDNLAMLHLGAVIAFEKIQQNPKKTWHDIDHADIIEKIISVSKDYPKLWEKNKRKAEYVIRKAGHLSMKNFKNTFKSYHAWVSYNNSMAACERKIDNDLKITIRAFECYDQVLTLFKNPDKIHLYSSSSEELAFLYALSEDTNCLQIMPFLLTLEDVENISKNS